MQSWSLDLAMDSVRSGDYLSPIVLWIDPIYINTHYNNLLTSQKFLSVNLVVIKG